MFISILIRKSNFKYVIIRKSQEQVGNNLYVKKPWWSSAQISNMETCEEVLKFLQTSHEPDISKSWISYKEVKNKSWSSSSEVIKVYLVVQVKEIKLKSNSRGRCLSHYLSSGWGGWYISVENNAISAKLSWSWGWSWAWEN